MSISILVKEIVTVLICYNCKIANYIFFSRYDGGQLFHPGGHVNGALLRHLPTAEVSPMANFVAFVQDDRSWLGGLVDDNDPDSLLYQAYPPADRAPRLSRNLVQPRSREDLCLLNRRCPVVNAPGHHDGRLQSHSPDPVRWYPNRYEGKQRKR